MRARAGKAAAPHPRARALAAFMLATVAASVTACAAPSTGGRPGARTAAFGPVLRLQPEAMPPRFAPPSPFEIAPAAAPDVVEAPRAPEVAEALPGADPRCPAEMAWVGDRVCVDRWEGSLVTRDDAGLEEPFSPFDVVKGFESRVRAVSKAGVVPQGYISGEQASRACSAAGKRLCTPIEWETACRGPAKTRFPYGEERRVAVCNDDLRAVHPVAEGALKIGLPRKAWWRAGMNNPLINQLPNSLIKTGERKGCTNGYGVYDMVGNLHEWVDDADGTFRGGYYMDTSHNGDGCSYQTKAHSRRYHDYSTGFRCCKSPAPAP